MTNDGMGRIERINYVVGALMVLGALIAFGRAEVLGVAVGVAISCVNFWALKRLVYNFTESAKTGAASNRFMLILPKQIVLMGIVVLALKFLPISAAAFAVGFSVMFVSIIVELVYTGVAPRGGAPDGN